MAGDGSLAKIGSWAFILGVIIAVVAGVLQAQSETPSPMLTSLLIVLGLVVGFLNVTGKETTPFLLATVSLVIVSMGGDVLGKVATVGPYISGVLGSIMTFVVPATIIVALKAIYALASDE
ncbi:hypothetical protein HYV82_02575 [Candidatus Woesearchaeota archaeon]|nr:hypothetical protein [Candidatus Woesearchaeota archaeon]